MSPEAVLCSETLKAEALRLGFSSCGLAPAGPVAAERTRQRREWVEKGRHGTMAYLERNAGLRADPRLLVEGARTVVSVALNYYPSRELEGLRLSRYAYGRDYHDVVRGKLRQLLEAVGLAPTLPGQTDRPAARICCDTAPVDERYWAWRCGLGWIGRSGQLILPGAGSYFFLGELIVGLPADSYDTPLPDRCGSCRACVEACPTGALLGDGTMDARRCLSYLTIEHRGPLPEGTGARMGNCFYGCDRCAEACPWNRFAKPTAETAFDPSPELRAMTEADWMRLDADTFRRLFKGSAVKRAKFEGLQRNLQALKKT